MNEAQLGAHPTLKRHLPELLEVRSSSRLTASATDRRCLPAFLVLPRGEPLDVFMARQELQALQCVLVRSGGGVAGGRAGSCALTWT